jgi:hypothetical protein
MAETRLRKGKNRQDPLDRSERSERPERSERVEMPVPRTVMVSDIRSTSPSSTDAEPRRRRHREKDEIGPEDSISMAGDRYERPERSDRVRHIYAHKPGHYESDKFSFAVVSLLTAIAFALRFYKINHPDQVV